VVGSCKHGSEPSASVKGMEFVDCLNDYCLLKMDFCMDLIDQIKEDELGGRCGMDKRGENAYQIQIVDGNII
jgi:hypothetical protein